MVESGSIHAARYRIDAAVVIHVGGLLEIGCRAVSATSHVILAATIIAGCVALIVGSQRVCAPSTCIAASVVSRRRRVVVERGRVEAAEDDWPIVAVAVIDGGVELIVGGLGVGAARVRVGAALVTEGRCRIVIGRNRRHATNALDATSTTSAACLPRVDSVSVGPVCKGAVASEPCAAVTGARAEAGDRVSGAVAARG